MYFLTYPQGESSQDDSFGFICPGLEIHLPQCDLPPATSSNTIEANAILFVALTAVK